MTANSNSTCLREKGSVFQLPCPNRQYSKLGSKKFLSSANFTGRHIRNDFFFYSLFFTWDIIKQRSATATISRNFFLVFGMTPNSTNTVSKHGQRFANSWKLKKVITIYKTNPSFISRFLLKNKWTTLWLTNFYFDRTVREKTFGEIWR